MIELEQEVHGDYPPNLENLSGSIKLDSVPNPHNLKEIALGYLENSPNILKEARRLKKDVVAYASCHGREIMIGVGIASLVTGVTTSAVIIYRHRRKSDK